MGIFGLEGVRLPAALLLDLENTKLGPYTQVRAGWQGQSCRPRRNPDARVSSHSLQKETFFFSGQAAWSGGEGPPASGLGSELRIMWQRLLTFFADVGNLKAPRSFFPKEIELATSHVSLEGMVTVFTQYLFQCQTLGALGEKGEASPTLPKSPVTFTYNLWVVTRMLRQALQADRHRGGF